MLSDLHIGNLGCDKRILGETVSLLDRVDYWLLNAVEYRIGGERLHLSLGICGKTRRTAFISFNIGWMMLYPLIVGNIYIVDSRCEDSKRCLCLECEHNRTTCTSFKNKTGIGRFFKRKGGFIRFLKRIRRVENSLAEEIKSIDFGKSKMLRGKTWWRNGYLKNRGGRGDFPYNFHTNPYKRWKKIPKLPYKHPYNRLGSC